MGDWGLSLFCLNRWLLRRQASRANERHMVERLMLSRRVTSALGTPVDNTGGRKTAQVKFAVAPLIDATSFGRADSLGSPLPRVAFGRTQLAQADAGFPSGRRRGLRLRDLRAAASRRVIGDFLSDSIELCPTMLERETRLTSAGVPAGARKD